MTRGGSVSATLNARYEGQQDNTDEYMNLEQLHAPGSSSWSWDSWRFNKATGKSSNRYIFCPGLNFKVYEANNLQPGPIRLMHPACILKSLLLNAIRL